MLNRFMPALAFALWLTATAAQAQSPQAQSPQAQSPEDTAAAAAFVSRMAVDAKVTELSGVEVVARPKVTALSGVDVVATPKPKPTEVSGLDVVARPRAAPVSELDVEYPVKCLPPRKPVNGEAPPPQLVSTYPADGQTVPPGYAVLRLTFDLPMACRGSAGVLQTSCRTKEVVAEAVAREPEFAGHLQPRWIEIWHQSYDRRTLLILCKLLPGARYVMVFNGNKVWEHFVGLSGREPRAGQLEFATSDAPDVATVAEVVDRDPQLAALITRK